MNLLDCAGIAVPAGFLDNGLPWGITLVSRSMEDRKLLSYANLWQQQLQISPGKTAMALPAGKAGAVQFGDRIPVVVCGAHLQQLPLNWQLTERGATLADKTRTSASYHMYALAGGPPYRPALVRDDTAGAQIEVEVWQLPAENFGSFVAGIPAPLGIGKVELEDGRWLPGFICEPCGIEDAQEITELGGWRKYLSTLADK